MQQGRERYPCGEHARDALKAAVGAAVPVCETVSKDRYRRTIARCSASGVDLAAIMVSQGWAVDWPLYSGGAYDTEQTAAKQERRGLWAGFFVAPWDWRKVH